MFPDDFSALKCCKEKVDEEVTKEKKSMFYIRGWRNVSDSARQKKFGKLAYYHDLSNTVKR